MSGAERLAEVAGHLASKPLIAFDTEFLREKTFYPQLGLIQVADGETAWLVDPLAFTAEQMRPLLDVLVSPDTVKAAHSAEQDQECLFCQYGLVASPVFDTAIGAALTGRGDQVGLAPLLRKTLRVDLPKGHTRTNWLSRPLDRAMAEYAAADVLHLVALAELLLEDLDRRGRRRWALALSSQFADPERYNGDGAAVAAKLAAPARLNPREYAVLRELAAWREQRVRKRDIPRRWLAEDQILVQLARARPRRLEELERFRGLGARVRDYGPVHVLAAIERALAKPEEELEEPPRKLEPTPAEGAALGVLKCFLNFLAQENDVPLRYLMDSETPLLLLRGRFETVEDLRLSGLLDEGAIEIFGEELLAILKGRMALKIDRGAAVRFEPEGGRQAESQRAGR